MEKTPELQQGDRADDWGRSSKAGTRKNLAKSPDSIPINAHLLSITARSNGSGRQE